MNNFGIKISKEGKKIDSEDSLDYVLNSKYPNIFTSKVGNGTYLFNDSSFGAGTVNIVTAKHDLGRLPHYLSFLSDNNANYIYLPITSYHYASGGGWTATESINAYCDKQNFYIDFVKTATGSPPSDATAWKDMAGISFNFKYYVFANEVN